MKLKSIIFFLGSFSVFAQNSTNLDSLKTQLAVSNLGNKEYTEITLELARFYNHTDPDSTLKYMSLAKEYAETTKDKKLIARSFQAEANYFQNRSLFKESVQASEKVIAIYEELNDKLGLARAYNTLGLTYKKNSGDNNEVVGFSEKALAYENKALEYYLLENDFDGLLRVYSNIGIIHRDLKQFKEAEASYLKGIEMAEKGAYMGYSLGILKANLSQIYLDYYKKHHRAIELLNEALEIYDLNGIISSKEHAYRNISYNYTALKEYEKAIFYANKAVKIANDVKDAHRKVNAYSSLHHAQKMAGMYKESMENLEIVNDIEDSLFSMEKTEILAEMDAKFETVRKDAEIQVLTKTNELNKWRIWALAAGLLAFIALAFSLIQKRRKDSLIAEKERILSEERIKNAEEALESKKKELTAKVLQLAKKNEFLSSIEGEIESLKIDVDSSVSKASGRISRLIRRDINGDKQWEKFSEEFSSIHEGFISSLVDRHGDFTKSELRLISLLKMNLTSKEIADTLGISPDGIKKARYRLRKKLKLEDSQLQSYLLNFS